MDDASNRSTLRTYLDFLKPGPLLAIAWSCYQVYLVVFGFQTSLLMGGVHLAFALALVFINKPLGQHPALRLADWAAVLLSLAMGLYIFLNIDRFQNRMEFVDEIFALDFFFGVVVVVLVMEGCRRLFGWNLLLVGGAFLAYAFLGPRLPSELAHRGMGLWQMVEVNLLTVQGIFGIPLAVSALYIFYFVLFAAFLDLSGGGDLFIDLAFKLTGRFRGGSAKSAVMASGLMGTISGSAVANTVSTGVFTIPLMKKSGYPAVFAGAVEAVASTGGQIMPPIMGAGAFIMAEMIGIPYLEVIKAALIPATIYYVSLFLTVDLKARQEGIKGLPPEDLPDTMVILKRIHLVIPLVVLVGYIVSGSSLMMAAFRGILATTLLSFLNPKYRLTPSRILLALQKGAERVPTIAVPSALAGIVIGVISFTGLGLKFSGFIMALSGESLFLALILIMVSCIILGMGMPTASAYILAAVLLAPVLEELGIPRVGAHLFIFYFAILSMVTPPIALCSYAAAGIAESDIMRTGVRAFQLAMAGFLVPYVFVFNPAMLMQGGWMEIFRVSATCILGVWALGGALLGYFFGRLHPLVRLLLASGALLLISPQMMTDAGGISMILGVLAFQLGRNRSAAYEAEGV